MSMLKKFSFVLKIESLSKIAEPLIKSAFERLFCFFVQFLCSHVFHVLIPLSKMVEILTNSRFFDKGIFHVLQDTLQQHEFQIIILSLNMLNQCLQFGDSLVYSFVL